MTSLNNEQSRHDAALYTYRLLIVASYWLSSRRLMISITLLTPRLTNPPPPNKKNISVNKMGQNLFVFFYVERVENCFNFIHWINLVQATFTKDTVQSTLKSKNDVCLMLCPSLAYFDQRFYSLQLFKTPWQNSSLHINWQSAAKRYPVKNVDIGVMSRWLINAICHSVFLRYCAIIFCYLDK